MFRHLFKKDENEQILDDLIKEVSAQMDTLGPYSDEYPELMNKLERLCRVKNDQRSEPVSRNTLALIAGNLLGILVIVAYEQKHVLTSKGFTQLFRLKTPN